MTKLPDDVVVASVARTPFGKFEGALSALDAPTLGALAIDEAVRRAGIAPLVVDAVYGGVGLMAAAMLTPMREAMLRTHLPETTPSAAIDRACCSGMTAIGFGFKDIRAGLAKVVVCGGFESLSQTPRLLPRRQPRIGSVQASDPLLLRGTLVEQPIAVYSGEESLRLGVSREEQDRWAVQSHARYAAAQAIGYFDFERFSVRVTDSRAGERYITEDESPRPDATYEKLARLTPVYGGKTITAGNAPGLNDGAAFIVLCRYDFAQAHGLPVLARIIDYVQLCGGPTSGTSTPGRAIQQLGERNKLGATQLDLLEINEAYAATPLVSTQFLADGDVTQKTHFHQRTNIHGGAVALGHPLGASGARIVMTLINGLRRRGGGRGAAAICGGFGQGDGVLLEVS